VMINLPHISRKIDTCFHKVVFSLPFNITSEQEGCMTVSDLADNRQIIGVSVLFQRPKNNNLC